MVEVEVAKLKKLDDEKKNHQQEVEKKDVEKKNYGVQKESLWAKPKSPHEKESGKTRRPWNDANMRENMERRKQKKKKKGTEEKKGTELSTPAKEEEKSKEEVSTPAKEEEKSKEEVSTPAKEEEKTEEEEVGTGECGG